MNEYKKEGTKNEVTGAMKEGLGKATNDRDKEVEGNVQKNVGKVQREVGEASEDVRKTARENRTDR